jgi:hypothetical protein
LLHVSVILPSSGRHFLELTLLTTDPLFFRILVNIMDEYTDRVIVSGLLLIYILKTSDQLSVEQVLENVYLKMVVCPKHVAIK